MTDALRQAAKAVVDRWDSPNWSDNTHTADYINALRAALAQQPAPSAETAGPTATWGAVAAYVKAQQPAQEAPKSEPIEAVAIPIYAANPAAILALLDDIDALQSRLAECERGRG